MRLLKSMTEATPETRMVLLLLIAHRQKLHAAPISMLTKHLGVSKNVLTTAIKYLLSEGYLEDITGMVSKVKLGGPSGRCYEVTYTALTWYEESLGEAVFRDDFIGVLELNVKERHRPKLKLASKLLLLVLILSSKKSGYAYGLSLGDYGILTGINNSKLKYHFSQLAHLDLILTSVGGFSSNGGFGSVNFIYGVNWDNLFSLSPSKASILVGCILDSSPYDYIKLIMRLELIYRRIKLIDKPSLLEHETTKVVTAIMKGNDDYINSHYYGYMHCCSQIGHVIHNNHQLTSYVSVCQSLCINHFSQQTDKGNQVTVEEIVRFLKELLPFNEDYLFVSDKFVSIYEVPMNAERFFEQCKNERNISHIGLFYYLWAESILPFVTNLSQQIKILSDNYNFDVESVRYMPKSKAIVCLELSNRVGLPVGGHAANAEEVAMSNLEQYRKNEPLLLSDVVKLICTGSRLGGAKYGVLGTDTFEDNSRVTFGDNEFKVSVNFRI